MELPAEGASAGIISNPEGCQGQPSFHWVAEQILVGNPVSKVVHTFEWQANLDGPEFYDVQRRVVDHLHGDARIHWDTRSPIVLRPAFVGEMHATGDHGEEISSVWGIMLYK
jgi:hypothetical protein